MRFNSENLVGMIPSDITAVMANGDVYSGKFDREKADYSQDLKGQPIWQIRKTAVAEGTEQNLYETKYPEGLTMYGFKWSDMLTYTYAYSKN